MRKVLHSSLLSATIYLAIVPPASGFAPLGITNPNGRQTLSTAESSSQGVVTLDEWPNLDRVFAKIRRVSPLMRSVMDGENQNRGLVAVEDDDDEQLEWKTVETARDKSLHTIQRIDNYDGLGVPMLRFRASLTGLCMVELEDGRKLNTGLYFTRYIVDRDTRQKWDSQIKDVSEPYTFRDLEHVNKALGLGRYGRCSHLGIGFCQTKSSFGIGAREQLFLYGLQDFEDGSCMVWGTELDENNNHLLPQGKRLVRSKNHVFAVTVTPKTKESFDFEYITQMEIGGALPLFLTTPVLIFLIKRLAATIEKEFSEGSTVRDYLQQKAIDAGSSIVVQ